MVRVSNVEVRYDAKRSELLKKGVRRIKVRHVSLGRRDSLAADVPLYE